MQLKLETCFKTLKIIGFTIIDGGGSTDGVSGAAIQISNSGVVFENCVIKDSDNQHPAILVQNDGGAIFRDCIIKSNRSHNTNNNQLWGAGMEVQTGGTVMLDRTKVLENHTANTGGGGEGHRGAGIYAENSTVYLINSLIAGNFIEDSNGGSYNRGTALYASNTELVIVNSTITDNQVIDNQFQWSGTAFHITGSSA